MAFEHHQYLTLNGNEISLCIIVMKVFFKISFGWLLEGNIMKRTVFDY